MINRPFLSRFAAAALLSMAIAGCGEADTTTQARYAPSAALIRQFGVGSEAMANAVTVDKGSTVANPFADPSIAAANKVLLTGAVGAVNNHELARIATANGAALTRLRQWLPKIAPAIAALRAAYINPASYASAPTNIRTLIGAWDRYIKLWLGSLTVLRSAVAQHGARSIEGYQPVIERAKQVRSSPGAAARFVAAREQWINEARTVLTSLAARKGEGTVPANADDEIANIVNHNEDAERLFAAVNAEYPKGFLAQRASSK
jgi:hypothetical protein